MANELRTYGDTSIREDVRDEIELISAMEDGIFSTLGKTTAINTVHSVQTDSLAAAGSLATAEGADYSGAALTTPSRVTNVCEIIRKDFSVSGTQRAVSHYGFEDAFAYQAQKAMKEWTNAAEFDLVRGTLVSGISGTAPVMNGIIASISTNTTAQTSGTIFSESIMNGLLQTVWDNGNGETASDVYVGAHLKKKVSGFAGRSGSSINVNDVTTAVNSIDLYIGDFGTQRVHLHRYVFVSGTDATQRFLAIRPDKWKVAYLQGREPGMEELSKVGDSTRGMVIGELTLEALNEATNVFASGYHLTS